MRNKERSDAITSGQHGPKLPGLGRAPTSGMNPKTLQYLMGHADINVTLNTYTHIQYEDAEKEVKKIYAMHVV